MTKRLCRNWIISAVVLMSMAWASELQAQAVIGSVVHAESDRPVPHVMVRLMGTDGPVSSATTNARGQYRLNVPSDGTYHIELSSVGFSPVVSDELTLSVTDLSTWNGMLHSAPVELSRLRVIAEANQGQFVRRRRYSRLRFSARPVTDAAGLGQIREVLVAVPDVYLTPSGTLRMRGAQAGELGPCMRMLFNEFSANDERTEMLWGPAPDDGRIEVPGVGTAVVYPSYGRVPEAYRPYAYSDDITQDPTRPRGVDTTPCGLLIVWSEPR